MSVSVLDQFIELANQTDGVEYYGKYNGRGYHTGFAITCYDMYDYGQFVIACNQEDLDDISYARPHIDSLGMGYIISWNTDLFDYDLEEDDEDE
jgi:hypothetical protein